MKISNLSHALARRLRRRVRKRAVVSASAAILAGGLLFAGHAHADPALIGWQEDKTTTPTEGPVEFFGWTFMNKDSWIATAEGQDRDSFTRAEGTLMVADGDEYDDSGDIGDDQMNVFIMTPEFSISDDPASATLNFDSSFRPYDTMTGLVDVSFDGGATYANLLTLDTASTPGGTSSLERADEAVALPLGAAPGDANAMLRFGLVDTGNDWWWAVDNIDVTVGGASVFAEDFEGVMLSPFVSDTESGGSGADWSNLELAQAGRVVPEPGSLALGGLAAAAGAGLARRRRDQK